MVAVVLLLQCIARPVVGKAILVGERLDFGLHLRQDFFLGNATDGCVLVIHRDGFQVVEFAEYAELAELADAREKYEPENAAQILERTEQFSHLVFERKLELRGFHTIKKWGIVFVNEYHGGQSRKFVGRLDEQFKTDSPGGLVGRCKPILAFPFAEF